MKFVIDAQLPRRLCRLLSEQGHDASHTLDLPKRNRTPDNELSTFADSNNCVVITKDDDFVSSHLQSGQPRKLLLVSTGNITNDELVHLFVANLDLIARSFESRSFVELTREFIIVHE
jgi:predicted nuclease of predicted toxin-antitoxin system